MDDLIVGLGLVFVVEGAIWALFPGAGKALAASALQTPEQVLRIAGLAAVAGGVALVWLIRGA